MMLAANIFRGMPWIIVIIHEKLRRFHQMNHGYGAAAWVAS
jgi:hypothetical protein